MSIHSKRTCTVCRATYAKLFTAFASHPKIYSTRPMPRTQEGLGIDGHCRLRPRILQLQQDFSVHLRRLATSFQAFNCPRAAVGNYDEGVRLHLLFPAEPSHRPAQNAAPPLCCDPFGLARHLQSWWTGLRSWKSGELSSNPAREIGATS